MADSNREIVLSGAKLRAAVKAAETPLTGALVKRSLATNLGLDALFEIDLRHEDVPPATLPIHPPHGKAEPDDE